MAKHVTSLNSGRLNMWRLEFRYCYACYQFEFRTAKHVTGLNSGRLNM